MRRGRTHRRKALSLPDDTDMPTGRISNFCNAKLHWIEVVTFEKTVKFGAVAAQLDALPDSRFRG